MSAEAFDSKASEIRSFFYHHESGGGVVDRYVRLTIIPDGEEYWMGAARIDNELNSVLLAMNGIAFLRSRPMDTDIQQEEIIH